MSSINITFIFIVICLCLDFLCARVRVCVYFSPSSSLSLYSMALFDLSDSQRMGAGLIGFAFFFILLGFALFFDRALLALGNIFLIVGVILLLVCAKNKEKNMIIFILFCHSGNWQSTNVFRSTGSFNWFGLFFCWYCIASTPLAHRWCDLGNHWIL